LIQILKLISLDAYFIKYQIKESKQKELWKMKNGIMEIANRLCRDTKNPDNTTAFYLICLNKNKDMSLLLNLSDYVFNRL